MIKSMEAASWLGQVAECLTTIATGLNENGIVPADAVGQLSFFSEQISDVITGSTLEPQNDRLQEQFHTAQTAIDSSGDNATAAAAVIAQVAGYFKAAAASCVPTPQGNGSAH